MTEVDEYINVDRMVLDEKSYENILVYTISYKKCMDAKPLRIRFNKVGEIIKIYNGIRYLKLSNSYSLYNEVYYRILNAIFDRMSYLINKKNGITDSINHKNYQKNQN